MKNFDYKKYLPHLVAVAVFVAITLAFYSPIMSGYEVRQGDVINYKGMAKEIQDFRRIYGEDPLWTNSMFGGMPAYQIDVENKTSLLLYVDRIMQLGFPGVIGYFFLLFVGFYIMLLCFRVNPWLAIIGAIAYAFSSYFVILVEAGHNTKIHALAYMPAVIGAFYLTLRGRMLLGAAFFTLFLALELLSNHLQITYYLFITLVVLWIAENYRVAKEKMHLDFFKRTGFLMIAAFIAVLANASNLWNTYEYGKDTTRGKSELTIAPDGEVAEPESGLDPEYITSWSYGKDETWTLLVPNAKGGGSGFILNDPEFVDDRSVNASVKQNIYKYAVNAQQGQEGVIVSTYWGDQPFTSGPTYIGAIIVFLFVLGMVYVNDPMKWGILAVSILAIMLAWGKNFMGFTEFFINNVPGYNKFRSVTMILTIVEFAVPFLAALLLKELWENPDKFKKDFKKFYITSGIVGGILLLMTVMPKSFISFLSAKEAAFFDSTSDPSADDVRKAVVDYRIGIFSADVMRSLGFVVAAFALIWLYLRNTLNAKILAAGIGILVLADMWSVDRRFLTVEKGKGGNYENWQKKGEYPYMPSQADMAILDMETRNNPELLQKVQEEMSAVPRDGKSNKEYQLDQIMLGAFPAINFNTDYRVFEAGDPFNSSYVSYFHKSIGGYHGAKLKRFQEVVNFQLGKENARVAGTVNQMQANQIPNEQISVFLPQTGVFNVTPVLNMLNAKYIIFDRNAAPAVNPNAAGPAWFATTIQWVPDANAEIQALQKLGSLDSVIIDQRFKESVTKDSYTLDSMASVKMVSYAPNHLIYETNNANDGFMVCSEIYYDKGWKATIDGASADYVRVNYILRGLNVPAGKHTVEFHFEPESYSKMKSINLAGNLIVLIVVGGLIWLDRRRKQKDNEIEITIKK